MAACCPSTALPAAKPPADYTNLGADFKIGSGAICYVTGDATSKFGLVVGPDVFGVGSGRTRQICDQLAALGFHVIMPDYFYGKPMLEDTTWPLMFQTPRLIYRIRQRDYPSVGRDIDSAADHLRQAGVERMGIVGFCYGGWVVFNACQQPSPFACGVGFHPSLLICRIRREKRTELMKNIGCPLMLLSAGDDPEDVKPKGLAQKALTDTSVWSESFFKEYPTMNHGWVNRGDLSDPKVAHEVADALQLAGDFLVKHVQQK